jgi:tubulin polyglutamylase TTLL6/13
LGFDIILDHRLKPWLLEVNHAPSFATDTPLDKTIKYGSISDAIKLLGLTAKNRKKYFDRIMTKV